jgi:ParB/RepB/Spo0J family partition protein
MSKNDILNTFFSGEQQSTTPSSKSIKKKYSSHKLFDDPTNTAEEHIIDIDTKNIYISPHKVDRLKLDKTKLQLLADNISSIGQLQPCTVRFNPNNGIDYELIFGERRYRAAIIKNIMLKVVVKDIDLHTSALLLLSENRNREDNTDYDLSRQITKFLDSDILKQSDIVHKTGISKQKISKLLCFNKIPKEIIEKINDFNKVSASTAECIYKLSNTNDNICAILSISSKISSGEYGHSKISRHVEVCNNKVRIQKDKNKHYSTCGRHLFTIRNDNNNNPSIHFPQDILKLISTNNIKVDEMKNHLAVFFEDKINTISRKSPGGQKINPQ